MADAPRVQEVHALRDFAQKRCRDGPLLPHHRPAEQALPQRLLQPPPVAVRLRERDLERAAAAVADVLEGGAGVAVGAQDVRVHEARHQGRGGLGHRLLYDVGLGLELEDVAGADGGGAARLGACIHSRDVSRGQMYSGEAGSTTGTEPGCVSIRRVICAMVTDARISSMCRASI